MADRSNRNKNNFNQNQQIIEQKNRMDPATTMHHLPEVMVDFELLWRGISKIRRRTQRWCMRGELLQFGIKKVYNNGIVQFPMFILVSMPLGFVLGDLSGPPWGTF